MKTWEEMTVNELKQERERLLHEYENEPMRDCDAEFTKQEIKELNRMIEERMG